MFEECEILKKLFGMTKFEILQLRQIEKIPNFGNDCDRESVERNSVVSFFFIKPLCMTNN